TAVTYIVQRMAGLAGMFYVMAMYFYLKARTNTRQVRRAIFFVLCAGVALLAFASKENAAMLAVTFFLFELFLIQGVTKENLKSAARFAAVPVFIFAVLAVFYVDFSSFLSGYEGRPFTLGERLMTEPRVIMLYISLLFYPVSSRLMLIHDIPLSHSLIDPWTTAASILLIVALLAAALCYSKKWPLIAFCVIFFFINHVIESSIIPLELVYEHRNYIPSMFFFVLVAIAMVRVLDYFSYRKSIQFIMAFGFCFLLAAQAHTVYERNEVWQNEILLWSDNAQKASRLSRVHTNLGRAYADLGIESEAVKRFKKALELKTVMRKKGMARLFHNAGLASHHEGEDEDAVRYFQQALKVNPGSEDTLALLCQVYLEKGMLERAYQELRVRVTNVSNLRSPELLKTYALVMYHLDRVERAIELAEMVLQKNSDQPEALAILAQSFKAQGNTGKAKWYWRRYLEKRPGSLKARLALIELYASAGNTSKVAEIAEDLFCLSRDREVCGIIEKGDECNSHYPIYTPDMNVIQKATENVLSEKAAYFMECSSLAE
ncbi:MAG: tetratricopeptide repeat protein, partial [Desulfobacteraceae bacterium]|nr:tetratricopeptide repeat protein [Desulfobacteraceae bacterium]